MRHPHRCEERNEAALNRIYFIMARRFAALGMLVAASVSPHAQAASAAVAPAATPVYLQWVSVDPHRPATLYAGSALACSTIQEDLACGEWIQRSTDGGTTWADLSQSIGSVPTASDQGADSMSLNGCYTFSPFLIEPVNGVLYSDESRGCTSPAGGGTAIERSADGGLRWQEIGAGFGNYGAGYWGEVISPARPARMYAVNESGQGGGEDLVVSDDAGKTWRDTAGQLPTEQSGDHADWIVGALVPDPTDPQTVYANVVAIDDNGNRKPAAVLVSTNAGGAWKALTLPAGVPDPAAFTVSIDPFEPGILLASPRDTSAGASTIYMSHDHGQNWVAGHCFGHLGQTCPSFVVGNVFGAGASYAFLPGGVYRIAGGVATARLAISAHLPVPTSQILDVQAGPAFGDPIYVLARGTAGTTHGVLYRSADAGQSWHRLGAGIPPNVQPASHAHGTIYVRTTHHSVAAPFVATYRKLGALGLGYPLTEAYLEGTRLTQIFQHLALQVAGGKVRVVDIGDQVLAALVAQQDPAVASYDYDDATHSYQDTNHPVQPVPNTATQRYFPQTHHILRGAFLRYWESHGGMAVLGAPITEVVHGPNGDGSGRSYAMQYFQNARVELHPENRDPRYAVLLGLLGHDALRERGWVRVSS